MYLICCSPSFFSFLFLPVQRPENLSLSFIDKNGMGGKFWVPPYLSYVLLQYFFLYDFTPS